MVMQKFKSDSKRSVQPTRNAARQGKIEKSQQREKSTPMPRAARSQAETKSICVYVDQDLLRGMDTAAKRLHISRSEFIARGLRKVLKRAG